MIDKLPYGFLNSVYGFNDYTLNELICKLAQKMDEVITQANESFSYLDWIKGEGLTNEVINILSAWKEDGTLTTIINNTIFNELNSKLDTLQETVNTHQEKIDTLQQTVNTLQQTVITLEEKVNSGTQGTNSGTQGTN